MSDKRDECGCHRECTWTAHECPAPCTWPSCLTEQEAAELAEELRREIG